jgi:hypothetical protein
VITIETGVIAGGYVWLRITSPHDDATVAIVMTPDEAREFSNSIGETILAATRSEVLT